MSASVQDFVAALRLDRSRRRWRLFALILFVLLVISLAGTAEYKTALPKSYIAQIEITGMMTHSPYAEGVIDSISKDKKAKALMVFVDSPGGTMVGGMKLFEALRRVSDSGKPVTVYMGTVAASAGYLASLAGDYVVANEATLTGSVGVLMPLVDVTELTDKIGIKSDEITSGALKAITSPTYKRSESDRAHLQEVVNKLMTIFLEKVQSRRPDMTEDDIATIRDGRVIIGAEALKLHMVDAIGGRPEVRKWLETEHKISQDIPVITFELEEKSSLMNEILEGQSLLPKHLKALFYGGALAIHKP
ncbi:MAG: signal peptide peptidase SppA [Proteobacteria bacterium]|nr:signal peptide peptidase SppA [Pseudomonadota bacterium]